MSATAPLCPDRLKVSDAVRYVPFVRRIVTRLARRLPAHVSLDDLVSAGVVGLLEAVQRFDPAIEQSFERFAEFRIKGAVIDELRRRDVMARDARLEAKRIERTIQQLTVELGRPPEQEEVAAALQVSLEEYLAGLEKLAPVRVLSLDDVCSDGPMARDGNPFDETAKRQLCDRLARAIAQLTERQQLVLQLYYREALTMRQVGEVLGVTESRICQVLTEATLRLRGLLGAGDADAPAARAGKQGGDRG